MSYVLKDQVMVQHEHIIGSLTAFKSKPDEWLDEIKINQDVNNKIKGFVEEQTRWRIDDEFKVPLNKRKSKEISKS